MNRRLNEKLILLYPVSLLMPFIIILIALIGMKVTPFGDKTLVIADANGLYINYLGYVGRFVKGLETFTYSFEKGLGGNMMPHMGGTMSNPIFALVALFGVEDYTTAFTWISTLNFAIAGLTMHILLADLFGHKGSNLIFSTIYALSGFLVANVFQIIFFNGVHALPLMVLGLRKIFQEKSPLLYILSLAYSLITGFYFGFTLCVFSVVLFFTYMWLHNEDLMGRRLRVFINYAISSLCAGFISIIIWLPAFMGIMGGRLDQTGISDFSFVENMPFLEIFSKLFTGANSTAQLVDGLPNIFVGLLPVALVVLFFMNKGIDRREKIAAAVILGFYLLSFYIVAFDMLMHGGTTTNWFNYRYSYIFSFVLLIIAAYEWQYLDSLSFKEIKNCFIGMLGATVLIFSKSYEYVNGGEVLLDFALLILFFLAYYMYRTRPEKNPKRTFEMVTALVVSMSLFFNYLISTKNIMDWGITESDYTETVTAVASAINGIKYADHSFYRMEVNNQRVSTIGNDPMLYGYNGVSHGGSNERNFVREELNKLGVQWFDMRNYYDQGIPAATDALLGIRYMVADQDLTDEKGYTRLTNMKDMGLADSDKIYDIYYSDYALPIAFMSEKAVNDLALDYDDLFDNLNRVWQSISGTDELAFVEEDDISFRSLNLAATFDMDADEARAIVAEYETESDENNESDNSDSEHTTETHSIMDKPPEFSSCVEFSFTAAEDGPVYVYHRAALNLRNGSTETVVKDMGFHHKGDTVTGYLLVQGDYVNKITFEEFSGRFRAAYADLDALRAMSAEVMSQPTTIEKVKDNHLKGTLSAAADQELLFTIPWDEGWTCYIDGQETELTKVLGVFMAAEVPAGEHTFEMKYEPAGLGIGTKIAIVTAVFTVVYVLVGRKLIDRLKKEDTPIPDSITEPQGETDTDTPATEADAGEQPE